MQEGFLRLVDVRDPIKVYFPDEYLDEIPAQATFLTFARDRKDFKMVVVPVGQIVSIEHNDIIENR